MTVEATIAFPIYIIAILTIVSFMNIFYTHAVIQQALNNTALRIAEYSYALKATDSLEVFDWNNEANAHMNQLQSEVQGVSNSAKSAMTSFSKGFTIDTLPEIIDNAKGFSTSVNGLANHLSGIDKNSLGKYAVGVFIGNTVDKGGASLVEALVKNYMTEMKLNLTNVKNMDFSKSQFYYGPNKDVTLVVTYEYENPFGIKLYDSAKMMQSCTVHPWIGSKG